jgi:hypothetical protein
LKGSIQILESLGDLLPKPKYGKPVPFQSDPLIPGKTMETMVYAPMEDSRDYQTIENEFRINGKVLFAYGFVRYEDIFGRMHDTRFGVRSEAWKTFNPTEDHFVIAGPRAYNKYT